MASQDSSSAAQQRSTTKLLDYAFFPGKTGWRTAVSALASKARDEEWGKNNVILSNYLKYLFRYITTRHKANEQTDRGIAVDPTGNWSAMHTRLFTGYFSPIYALFEKNKVLDKQLWLFKGWEAEFDLLRENIFVELPKPVYFCSKHYELHFDPEILLHYDVRHILQNDKKHGRMHKLFPDKSDGELQTLLAGAIDRAKRRVEQNTRTVVPQYFASTKCIQLLLPLSFDGSEKAQLVLPCERVRKPGLQHADPLDPSHWRYLASTILDTSMAYNNARLLNRLESEWLTQPDDLNIPDDDDADDDAKSVA